MSTLWIREYATVGAASSDLNAGSSGNLPIALEAGTDQANLTFSTSAASAAFAATTRYVTIYSDASFHYVVAAAPTATTAALPVPAYTHWTIGVTAGEKIAAINAV